MSLEVGEVVVITTTYKDDEKVLTDPSTPVTHVIKPPTGSNTEITATRLSEGVFESQFTATVVGRHFWSAYSDDVSIDKGDFLIEDVIAKRA